MAQYLEHCDIRGHLLPLSQIQIELTMSLHSRCIHHRIQRFLPLHNHHHHNPLRAQRIHAYPFQPPSLRSFLSFLGGNPHVYLPLHCRTPMQIRNDPNATRKIIRNQHKTSHSLQRNIHFTIIKCKQEGIQFTSSLAPSPATAFSSTTRHLVRDGSRLVAEKMAAAWP